MSDRLRLRNDLSWRTVADEIVVLDLRTTEYLSVQGAAVEMWELLAEGTDEDALVQRVLDEYDVDVALARSDVTAFVAGLRGRGFLR